MSNAIFYTAFCVANVIILKEVNNEVTEPYMVSVRTSLMKHHRLMRLRPVIKDEPFHIPQAQAYCRGEWTTWDPKITTPPGLYVMHILRV